MEKWKIDIPVKTNIWIRPECQKKQFDIIKEVKPRVLFLQSDGGRNEKEWELINYNRKMIDEGIDWECEVYRLYEEKNNGLYAMSKKTKELVWSKVDRCIFLEDDQLPAVSFFRFCKELLDKYENDLRIIGITGHNYFDVFEGPEADYFFSGDGGIWGNASWKRSYELSEDLSFMQTDYEYNAIVKAAKKRKPGFEKKIEGYKNNEIFGGHVAGSEFKRQVQRFSQSQMYIIPTKNMIKNIGYGKDSEHADDLKKLPKEKQRLFDMKVYELEGPIKHPKFVVCDVEYERRSNILLGYGHPFHVARLKIERAIRCIMYGDIKRVIKGVKNAISPRRES